MSEDSDPTQEDALYSMVNSKERMVQLISKDGQEFYVHEETARFCGVFKEILSGRSIFPENQTKKIYVDNVAGEILGIVLEYAYFKRKFINQPHLMDSFDIDDSILLDVLVAADYLQI